MTLDIDIGLRKDSKDLAAFLTKEGYTQVEKAEGSTLYARNDNPFPQIFHSPIAGAGDPNWRDSGYHVLSEVNINFPRDSDCTDEAERISEKITIGLNGILYDATLDECFTKEDLQ